MRTSGSMAKLGISTLLDTAGAFQCLVRYAPRSPQTSKRTHVLSFHSPPPTDTDAQSFKQARKQEGWGAGFGSYRPRKSGVLGKWPNPSPGTLTRKGRTDLATRSQNVSIFSLAGHTLSVTSTHSADVTQKKPSTARKGRHGCVPGEPYRQKQVEGLLIPGLMPPAVGGIK